MALTKAGKWMIEGLNEKAALHYRGEGLPNHTPSAPGFWFAGLVRETGWAVETIPSAIRELLTPDALKLWSEVAA